MLISIYTCIAFALDGTNTTASAAPTTTRWPGASLTTAQPSTPLQWPWLACMTSGISSTFPRECPCHVVLGVTQAVATECARSRQTARGLIASVSRCIPERPVGTSGVGRCRWWRGQSCAGSGRECVLLGFSCLFVRSFWDFSGGLLLLLFIVYWLSSWGLFTRSW